MNSMDLMEAMEGIRPAYLEAAQRGREQVRARKKVVSPVFWARAAAAAIALSVILPNTSPQLCYAMQNIPVVGAYFKLVTFRSYSFADANHEAEVSVSGIAPDVEKTDAATAAAAQASADQINSEMAAATDALIAEFQSTLESEGHSGLIVNSEVVTDTDQWYVLRLNAYTAQADGYEQRQYYVLNRQTGERVMLKDLFRDGSNYREVISENIKAQMRGRMAENPEKQYFVDTDMTEDNFREIREDQQFYLDGSGSLVIAFNEGEVAPMSEGAVEFTIPAELVKDILK